MNKGMPLTILVMSKTLYIIVFSRYIEVVIIAKQHLKPHSHGPEDQDEVGTPLEQSWAAAHVRELSSGKEGKKICVQLILLNIRKIFGFGLVIKLLLIIIYLAICYTICSEK